MTAITRDLIIEQGTTFVFGFTLSDTTVDENGSPVVVGPKDLTATKVAMQIRVSQGSTLVWEGTTENGKIVLGREAYGDDPGNDDPTNGRVIVIISDEDSDAFTVKKGVYDLETVDLNPRMVVRVVEGKVTVGPNITQHVTGDAGGDNDEVLA